MLVTLGGRRKAGFGGLDTAVRAGDDGDVSDARPGVATCGDLAHERGARGEVDAGRADDAFQSRAAWNQSRKKRYPVHTDALAGRFDPDHPADLVRAAEHVDVIQRQQPALRMTDQVDFGRSGRRTDSVDEGRELQSGGAHRADLLDRAARGTAVVESEYAVTVCRELRGETRPVGVGVLEGAIDEHHRTRIASAGEIVDPLREPGRPEKIPTGMYLTIVS